MDFRIAAAFGLILATLNSAVAADECRSYMAARVLHDVAVQADREGYESWRKTGEMTSAMHASAHFDARKDATRARDEAAAVRSVIDDDTIATAISAIALASAEADIAHEAVMAWIDDAEASTKLRSPDADHVAMAQALFNAAAKVLSVRVDIDDAYHEAVQAVCLQRGIAP